MSTITPKYLTVKELLQSQPFAIDEYQREYKWEKENIDELLSDLQGKFFGAYKPEDETTEVKFYDEYFLGSIIVSKRDGKKYLIDGQQRVTSLTLLLICIHRAAEARDLNLIAQTIAPLIYSDSLGELKFNLDIPERLPVIEALFKGKDFSPSGKGESIKAMHARYCDIEENDLIGVLGKALPHFAYWLMSRVGLIEIATGNDAYAYAIFETMNDRGKPLSPVDMLKAYLLAPIEDDDLRKASNGEWKKQVFNLISDGDVHKFERAASCIKAWFRAQYAETIRERKKGADDKDWELIGSVFHHWVRDNCDRLHLGTENQNHTMICKNFPFFSKAYQHILNASRTYTKGLEAIYYNAHNKFTWQNTVLLASLTETDDDETVRRKLAVTATYLDIWLMRQTVNYIRVTYSNASYTMWLLCRDIRRKGLSDLVNILNKKLVDDEATLEGCPSKKRGGIQEFAINQSSRRYVLHLLARVTALIEEGSGRSESFDTYVDRSAKNPFDIEHIWANDYEAVGELFSTEQEFQEWRNHAASLVLLPADVNRSLQDKPFDKKQEHYAKQNFYAASLNPSAHSHQPKFKKFCSDHELRFNAPQKFGKEEQKNRRELLLALAKIIWSPERLRKASL